MFVSTILALPNLFGDDEAVQVSRSDGVAVDSGALAQTTDTLKATNVPFKSARSRRHAALIRFPTVDGPAARQHRAREALPNNVVALTLSSRTPEWLRVIGLKPMALGLDLRGGVHFLYQVDLNAAIRQYLHDLRVRLRTQLREAKIRNDIRVVGDTLRVAIVEPGRRREGRADHPQARQRAIS